MIINSTYYQYICRLFLACLTCRANQWTIYKLSAAQLNWLFVFDKSATRSCPALEQSACAFRRTKPRSDHAPGLVPALIRRRRAAVVRDSWSFSGVIRALEDIIHTAPFETTTRSLSSSRVHAATSSPSSHSVCSICKRQHFFSSCQTFMRCNPSQRRDLVMKHRRCFNYLSANHSANECKSKYSCRTCHKRHHKLLQGVSDSKSSLDNEESNRVTLRVRETCNLRCILCSLKWGPRATFPFCSRQRGYVWLPPAVKSLSCGHS